MTGRSLVRVVAAAAAAWRSPTPPPLLSVGHVDISLPPELLLFSGNELRDFAASEDHQVPAHLRHLEMTPPAAREMNPAAEPPRTLLGAPRPGFLVAHGATALRSLLLPEERTHAWICTQRVARRLWPDEPSYDLSDLVASRRLHPAVSACPAARPAFSVLERALHTTLLLVHLLQQHSIHEMREMTKSFLLPLHPAPDLDDAVGWAQVPDDDLTWLSRLGDTNGAAVRQRAFDEMERRDCEGWATPVLGEPPIAHA